MVFRWLWARSEEASLAEKRRYPRRKKKGRALLVQERSRKPCRATIVDQMEKGARVLVKDAGELPDELYLIDLDSGMAHQANVAWRSSDEVGLEFARSIMLDATTPNDLLHLRDFWIRAA